MEILVRTATLEDCQYAEVISQTIEEASKSKGSGIAKRTVEYIDSKIKSGRAIIATTSNGEFAGFCYIETWGHGNYVANSGLIVASNFRNLGLAAAIKKAAFDLSRKLFPQAKLFGLTTHQSVMNINSDLGYRPVTYDKLTDDEAFWAGCKSCVHFETLMSKNHSNCLCTAMIYDPQQHERKNEMLNYMPPFKISQGV